MRSQGQNTGSGRLTIFKPPGYIYKLSKSQNRNQQKLQYDTYFNAEHSLRKYSRTLNLSNQSQLLLYQWRKQSVCPIIKVVYLQLVNKTISSSTSQNSFINVNVYTQNIEKTLADMINLTLGEAIYVLKQCILAYQELFLKFSAVSINKFYIGLNADGKLKVWINDNLSLNCNPQRSSQTQIPLNQVLIVEPAIVNKIIHMVSLLANTTCKFFFFGLQKELQFKRFSFNNCLQYINNFVINTKNLEIPCNLTYMLPKKNSFCIDRSNVKFLGQTRMKTKTVHNHRKQNSISMNNTHSFKQFTSMVRQGARLSTQDEKQPPKDKDEISTNNPRFKRYSEQLPRNLIANVIASKRNHNITGVENQDPTSKQCRISLHVIMQKNRRNSIKSTDILVARKSNISQRQRPSICIVPTFINKSSHVNQQQDKKNRISSFLSNQKETDKSRVSKRSKKSKRSQKSYSLQSSKSKDYHSLLNSKVGSINLRKFGFFNREELLYRTHKPQQIKKHETQVSLNNTCQKQQTKNSRARSVSTNIKFGAYKLRETIIDSIQPEAQHNERVQMVRSDHRKKSLQKSKIEADKTSTNSISNQGTAKKRSFLTKTNYDSITQDNDKNFSNCRMNFSSMSIENRITNKNFDSDLTNSRKEEVKRSLMSFKYGFEQILENPSCKQVEEQNQTKSYNGSSLRNTQNIAQQLQKIKKKNQDTTSNNFSFGKNSNKLTQRRQLKDSVEQNWDLIKQKNQEVLVKNQWKKTINNLDQLQNMALNQSIIDACDDIIQRDLYPDVRLQKLQRLGKNMCFSIVNRADEGAFNLTSSVKKSDVK